MEGKVVHVLSYQHQTHKLQLPIKNILNLGVKYTAGPLGTTWIYIYPKQKLIMVITPSK